MQTQGAIRRKKSREHKTVSQPQDDYKNLGINPKCRCFENLHPGERRELATELELRLKDKWEGEFPIKSRRVGCRKANLTITVTYDINTCLWWVEVKC
jgi:hypothetical protein